MPRRFIADDKVFRVYSVYSGECRDLMVESDTELPDIVPPPVTPAEDEMRGIEIVRSASVRRCSEKQVGKFLVPDQPARNRNVFHFLFSSILQVVKN